MSSEPMLVLENTSEYHATYRVNARIYNYPCMMPYLDALEKSGLQTVSSMQETVIVKWRYRWSPYNSVQDLPELITPSEVKGHVQNKYTAVMD